MQLASEYECSAGALVDYSSQFINEGSDNVFRV